MDFCSRVANFERSYSSEDAEVAIMRKVRSIESLDSVTFKHYRRDLTDVVYVLDNNTKKEITYGLGKGIHSKLGAFGECLEHYFYRNLAANGREVCAREFDKGFIAKHDVIWQFSRNLDGYPNLINCIDFYDILSGDRLPVPRILINYHDLDHDKERNAFETFLGRYVTNSGSAFGVCAPDATLHALNETIERDTTSRFFMLLAGIPFSPGDTFYRLETPGLPKHLYSGISYLKDRYPGVHDVELIVTRNRFNTWWCICILKGSCLKFPFTLAQWGAGNSLLFDLAIYRSISECIQMANRYESENKAADQSFKNFSNNKSINKIANFGTQSISRSMDYLPSLNIRTIPVIQQVKNIATSLASKGHRPCQAVFHESENGAFVSTYVPNMERFYNITKSVNVLPLEFIKQYAQGNANRPVVAK